MRFLTKLKNAWIRTVCRDTFNRDVLTLLVVSIFIGSIAASAVSMASDTYLSKTVNSLVGDYGENDLIIQVREETKQDAKEQIQKVIQDVFPGAKLTEGPTVTGKTNFFVALPEQYKTKPIYDNMAKTFGSIPGGGSVGFMSEPHLTLRGVPQGARNMVMDAIAKMDGVRFPYNDGSSIGVLVTSLDKMPSVTNQINDLLKQYQIIEISFPVGSEPSNPIRLGETIADDLKTEMKLSYAANASVDGKNDDMTYMVSTMMEMKRFLESYASKVTLTPAAGTHLAPGDIVAFSESAQAPLTAGAAVDKSQVLVEVTAVGAQGTLEGRITQGDAQHLTNAPGYKVENGVIGTQTAAAAYNNPRQNLGNALTETSKLVGQIPGLTQDAQNMSGIASNALNNYGSSVNAMAQLLTSLQAAGGTIERVTSGLDGINTSSLQSQLDNSARSIGGMVNTLQVVKLISNDAAGAASNLSSAQQNLLSMKEGLAALDHVAADGRAAKSAVDRIIVSGNSTLSSLRAFDVNGAQSNLANIDTRLAALQQINTPLVAAQLQYLAAATPSLKDEEITHSVKLLDQFIAGQVIPSARIQILTTNNISPDAIAPIVYREAGHNNLSLYSTSIGVIEPDTRGQVMQILNQVRGILAGMTSLVATVLFLLFDHTVVMSVMRRKRLSDKTLPVGWHKRILARLAASLTAPERQYGMVVGAIMLTAMFIVSKAGIPYLPWIGVPVIGAVLGLVVAGYAEKISPIAADELMAGESMGLTFDEIMREIVVPSGRPGLMQKLNARKMKFK